MTQPRPPAAATTARAGAARASLTAAGSVLLTSMAFSGVFTDGRWFIPSVMVAGAVAGTGILARARGWPPPVVALVQLLAMLLMVTMLFSGSAFLGFIPGPDAIQELAILLERSDQMVRHRISPVPAVPPLQLLVSCGVGLITLAVDMVVVTAMSPAVAGLILLCVFAIPASLANAMLPWWAFVAGAAGFVLLLSLRNQYPGIQRTTDTPGHNRSMLGSGKHSVAVAGAAGLVALLVGATFTGIGTQGRLPGSDPVGDDTTSSIGLRPFTALRGQLKRDDPIELFRVEGLPQDAYLRAMTLRDFVPGSGWKLAGLKRGVPVTGSLPLPRGVDPPFQRARIEIEPLAYRDAWLPVFGVPLKLSGMGKRWRYDPASGVVFTQAMHKSRPYVEIAAFPSPSPQQLRRSDTRPRINRAYLDIAGVPQRVIDLAERITAGEQTRFDKAVALNRFFTDPSNGFVYDLQTAPASSARPLVDFLFRGKRGYCEQFASAMAVLLRAVGITSRVAVGFTSGHYEDGAQVITTADAHAWVEAYFAGHGWITFDPTPLSDGRTSLPDYLDQALNPGQQQVQVPQEPDSTRTQETESDDRADPVLVPGLPTRPRSDQLNGLWAGVAVVVLAAALLAGPSVLRSLRRRRRRRTVIECASGAADTAWREILDEFWDRGTRPSATDTARGVGAYLVERHGLDTDGAKAMRLLVGLVERDWYGPPDGEQSSRADQSLPGLFEQVTGSLKANSPLSWQQRLLPRSVLRPRND